LSLRLRTQPRRTEIRLPRPDVQDAEAQPSESTGPSPVFSTNGPDLPQESDESAPEIPREPKPVGGRSIGEAKRVAAPVATVSKPSPRARGVSQRNARNTTSHPRKHRKVLLVSIPLCVALTAFAVVTTLMGVAGAIVVSALALAVVVWGITVGYSRRTWPYLGCKTCGGTGRDYEPFLLALLCLRRKRAWRDCGACSGKARYDRRDRSSRRSRRG
jgi:hypothetical protein